MCDPILGALIKMQPIILHLVVKIDSIQQHIPISPLLGSIPPPGGGGAHKVTSTTDEKGAPGYLTL